jgi:hypothetical protein
MLRSESKVPISLAKDIQHMIYQVLVRLNASGRTMALGLNQPLTDMSTRCISWG